MFLVSLTPFATPVALGQDFPTKPVRIVTAEASGAADIAARLISPALSAAFGQQVVVDNRASIGVAGETVAKSVPDGHVLILFGPPLWVAPMLQAMPYDAVRDFAPVTLIDTSPNVLVITAALPVKSVRELITMAKTHPGQLNYGSSSVGSTNHLAAELFKSMAHVDIVRVNYKGAGATLNDLIAGQVQLSFASAGSVTQHIKSGRLRGLAVTSVTPSPLFPGLPPMTTSGVPGYEANALIGLFAPATTPPIIVAHISDEVRRVLSRLDVKERFLATGVEASGTTTPEKFGAMIKTEIARWGKVIKDAGIREEWPPGPFGQAKGQQDVLSFAAITDEPPAEVSAAGHDRCIMPIKAGNIDAWLNADPTNLAARHGILDDRERPYYEHRIAA